jgi:hypothetical protein
VTGGSGAIGAAICRELARQGLHVLVHANANVEAAERVAGEITSAGGSAEAVAFDVTDRDAAAGVLGRIVEESPIQVLVNNAGIHEDVPLAGMRGEQWDRVIDVSLNGFYNVTQPLLLPMIRTRWGRIINVSSVPVAVAGACLARHHRQRGRARHHRISGNRAGVSERKCGDPRADEARRNPGGSRRADRIHRFGRRRLHFRSGDLDQRGNGVRAV